MILYDILNRKNRFLADRCYCPDRDLEKLLKENRIPLTGLETKGPFRTLTSWPLPFPTSFATPTYLQCLIFAAYLFGAGSAWMAPGP